MKIEEEKKELPYYMYRGVKGVIYDNEFIPVDKAAAIGLTADDCELCYDDTYFNCHNYGGVKEITYQALINDENEQRLIGQWVYVETAKEDYIKQQYLIMTDIYYDWNSKLSRCVKQIKDISNNDNDIIQRIIKHYLTCAKEDIDNCHPEVNVYTSMYDVINFLTNQFDNELKQYVKIITEEWRLENDR